MGVTAPARLYLTKGSKAGILLIHNYNTSIADLWLDQFLFCSHYMYQYWFPLLSATFSTCVHADEINNSGIVGRAWAIPTSWEFSRVRLELIILFFPPIILFLNSHKIPLLFSHTHRLFSTQFSDTDWYMVVIARFRHNSDGLGAFSISSNDTTGLFPSLLDPSTASMASMPRPAWRCHLENARATRGDVDYCIDAARAMRLWQPFPSYTDYSQNYSGIPVISLSLTRVQWGGNQDQLAGVINVMISN